MSRLIAPPLLAALLFALPMAATAQTVEEATSRIEIGTEDGAVAWQVQNSRFDIVNFWAVGAEAPRTLLIRQDETATMRTDMEGAENPIVGVAVFEVQPDATLAPLWSQEFAANTGAARWLGVFGHAYVTTLWGCCGAFDVQSYHALGNGAHLLTANGSLAMLEVPNSGGLIRFAGIETPWTAGAEPLFRERRDMLGIVSYASPDAQIELAALVLRGDAIDTLDALMALPELEWVPGDGDDPARELTLWSFDGEHDPANLAGVALRVTYTPDAWAEIPIVGDRFDLDAASLAPNLALERLP